MKVPLVYPKIPENSNKFFGKCIAFEKYDGTNMHWCWNLKDGWHTFGTRRTEFSFNQVGIELFIKEHKELQAAPTIFNDNVKDSLSAYLSNSKSYRNSEFIIFMEFYGPNSFAGAHDAEDARCNAQKLVAIDVSVDGKIIEPKRFIEDFSQFGGFDTARVIYTGKYTGQFTEDVRNGKFGVNEGVVVKGLVRGELFMTKIKTKEYLKRLRQR